MSNTLTLATRLRAMDDTELHDAVAARELPLSATGMAGIKDFFDLADALLDHSAVQQALTRLDRTVLTCLAMLAREAAPLTPAEVAGKLAPLSSHPPAAETVSAALERAAALLLVERRGDTYSCYQGVCEQLRSWPVFGLPGLERLAGDEAPAALEPVPEVDRRFIDRLAAERAFAATSSVTELLLELERQPARELAKGGVALPDSKRLASAMAVDLETVAIFLSLAERGLLVCREAGSWMTTETGNAWLAQPTRTRWRGLAGGWFARLPDDIRQLLAERSRSLWGDGLRSYIDWLYPAGGEWMDERITAYARDAELLGITAGQAPSGPGALLLLDRADEAEQAIHPLLPPEVDSVYLQHDLSVVAPGPLSPEIDARMRVLADVESRALATTYRISAASVNRALTSGETAESLREFLGSISKTGLPQPLEYLIAEGAARYGLIRAGELGDDAEPGMPEFGALSYLRSDDADLLRTVAVDQSLASLGLTAVGRNRLVSRFPLDVTFWSLSDARYPVAAENADGDITALLRHRVARSARPGTLDTTRDLIARLRLDVDGAAGAADEVTGHAWLVKQLEAAIRSKSALIVSVTMPGGNVVDYQLEPTSLGGGRLRARDSKSEIERTLPLSSIAGIRPAVS